MINVTQTFLPPQEEYQAILKRAWDAGWITNRGVLVKELEDKLKDFLNVEQIIAMTNGTLPLQIAIKALQLKGDIITTPFSYVATTSSIVWEGCTPVFVDVHPEYLTINESLIESAITPNTVAIIATHVYGNPCNVEAIEAIAKKYNLKVIYDAAHCFGVTYKGDSLFNYGDVSTCSFHATKLFHTGEGGALFCNEELYKTMYLHHNFGHDGPDVFRSLGINAKMSELQAAMGLAMLSYIDAIIQGRKHVVDTYNTNLANYNINTLKIREHTKWNYSYYPIIFNSEKQLLLVKTALENRDIFTRRYFYPSLDNLPYIKESQNIQCEVANMLASCVLCLPLYSGLTDEDLKTITNILIENL